MNDNLFYMENKNGNPAVRLQKKDGQWGLDKFFAWYNGDPSADEIEITLNTLNRKAKEKKNE